MTDSQKQLLQEGKLQIVFPRHNGRKISDAKELLTELFPGDPSKQVIVGNFSYITAFNRGFWKGSPTPFKDENGKEIPKYDMP